MRIKDIIGIINLIFKKSHAPTWDPFGKSCQARDSSIFLICPRITLIFTNYK